MSWIRLIYAFPQPTRVLNEYLTTASGGSCQQTKGMHQL